MSKSAITIKLEPYSYTYEGGYTGDAIITCSTARAIVKILDLVKTIEDDQYLHDTKDWINETFTKDQVDELKNARLLAQSEIKNLQEKIDSIDKKLNDFLVPVKIIK